MQEKYINVNSLKVSEKLLRFINDELGCMWTWEAINITKTYTSVTSIFMHILQPSLISCNILVQLQACFLRTCSWNQHVENQHVAVGWKPKKSGLVVGWKSKHQAGNCIPAYPAYSSGLKLDNFLSLQASQNDFRLGSRLALAFPSWKESLE